MPKTKNELLQELKETQELITACELVRCYDLGLDEATYEKYNNAIERQKEIGELLASMDERQLGIRTVVQFRRKEPVLQQDECEIEKVVELTREEFHHFKNNLLREFVDLRAGKTVSEPKKRKPKPNTVPEAAEPEADTSAGDVS